MDGESSSGITGVHHIGIVVESIDEAADYYRCLGFTPRTEPTDEPLQRVKVLFMALGETLIELIEPTSADSPVARFLRSGGSLNHLCYETEDLERSLEHLRNEAKAIRLGAPTRSESMAGAECVFLARRGGELIELVTKTSAS